MQEKVLHLTNVRDIAQYALEKVMHFLQILHMDQQTNEDIRVLHSGLS